MTCFTASLLIFVSCATLLRALPAGQDRSATLSSKTEESSPTPTAASPLPVSSTASAPPEGETVAPASSDPNLPIFPVDDTGVADPEPTRDGLGSNILDPNNVPLAQESPDFLAPPTTDHSDVPDAKWPFMLSWNHLQTGGWACQQNSACYRPPGQLHVYLYCSVS